MFLQDTIEELKTQVLDLGIRVQDLTGWELPTLNLDPTRDVLDGEYTGDLTIEDVIEQFGYRIGIHLSYIELNETNSGWIIYGSTEYHNWAINGYE